MSSEKTPKEIAEDIVKDYGFIHYANPSCVYAPNPDVPPQDPYDKMTKQIAAAIEQERAAKVGLPEFTKKEKTPPIKSFMAIADYYINGKGLLTFEGIEEAFTIIYGEGYEEGFNKALELMRKKLKEGV